MSLIMATLREHMDENEDLVLLFVRKKDDQKENNNLRQEEEEEEEDELRTVPDSELIPNLPEGISIRSRPLNSRSSTGLVTSCYGECRDTTEEEASTDNDTSTEGSGEGSEVLGSGSERGEGGSEGGGKGDGERGIWPVHTISGHAWYRSFAQR